MLEALLRVARERTGLVLYPRAPLDDERLKGAFGLSLTYLTFEDPSFQEALLHPVALALTTHMLGKNATVSDIAGLLKGPGGARLPLHADNIRVTAPFPAQDQICNITWVLTDYDESNGALTVVPGSHRHCRHPMMNEGVDEQIAIIAPAGSIIAFGGNLWHGAGPRSAPGLRANLILYMCRPHILPQGGHRGEVSDAQLLGRPERLRTLLGNHVNYGWKGEGPAENDGSTYLMGRHPYE
jgi:ectoine hydroxylase-related dioxygenase (phytanoyl-CoA dioxygenase family)